MTAIAVLERLTSLGVAVTVDGDDLIFRPGSKVPPDMITDIRRHKTQICNHLRQLENGHVREYYSRRFADYHLGDGELAETVRRVEVDGCVLLWSEVIADFIGVYETDADHDKIPPGFVPYSNQELWHLFGPDKPDLSLRSIRLLHSAKVLGMNITDSYPERKSNE